MVVGFVMLLLNGCNDPKKIDTADYGFKARETLYIKKVDSISELYDHISFYREYDHLRFGPDYSTTAICIDFKYDGQEKEFCLNKFYLKKEFDVFGNLMSTEDDKSRPNEENIENMKKLEKRLHQIANDGSIFESLGDLFHKLIQRF